MQHDAAAPAGRQPPVTLDLCPADGAHFFERWQRHRDAPQCTDLLHYVMRVDPAWAPRLGAALLQAHPPRGAWHGMAQQLALQCPVLDTQVQRILLDGGRVSLTLCAEAPFDALHAMRLQADEVLLDPAWAWDRWHCKALARLCRPGARIVACTAPPWTALAPEPSDPPAPLPWRPGAAWSEAGFLVAAPASGGDTWQAQANRPDRWPTLWYRPPWHVKRRQPGAWEGPPGRAAVIGAGLAGASVARALAMRGWDVVVLERGAAAASGASGLPVGLVVPHVSSDDSPRSQLSRSGVRLMLNHARHLLPEGHNWAQSGVEERSVTPHGPQASQASRWHAEAAWVQPAALVQAWLNHPRITLVCHATVGALAPVARTDAGSSAAWQLMGQDGRSLPSAPVPFGLVVLCHALQDKALAATQAQPSLPHAADQIGACTQVAGTLSFGAHPRVGPEAPAPEPGSQRDASAFPPHPVNGHGSFVAGVPSKQGLQWFCGSTFEADASALLDVTGQHHKNLQKLRTLLPDVAQALTPQFLAPTEGTAPALGHWQGSRCVSQDRMPLVGPLVAPVPGPNGDAAPPTLWMSSAMGARGLSFSAQCAELLVAELHGEPWPVPVSLARQLRADRQRRKTAPSLPVD